MDLKTLLLTIEQASATADPCGMTEKEGNSKATITVGSALCSG
jgi:hypothetical protein